MIEIISDSRCTGCNICVRVCPTNVFDASDDGAPVIARQDDCETCFQCEAYCPADALFVAPLRAPSPPGSIWRDEAALLATGQFGLYSARVGWGGGVAPPLPSDEAFSELMGAIRGNIGGRPEKRDR
jgi:NAD-dependent dihydropyrimidine dehydrogenase PreA subunit